MARVIARLREARAAGFEARREGDALIVRGPEDLGGVARDLLAHKPLVLAALEHEDEYRSHERLEHCGEAMDWHLGRNGRLVCSACEPPLVPAMATDTDGVLQAVMAAEDRGAAVAGGTFTSRTCATCGSTGRCEGRLPTTDGGWVCRAALAMGLFRPNGQRSGSTARLARRPTSERTPAQEAQRKNGEPGPRRSSRSVGASAPAGRPPDRPPDALALVGATRPHPGGRQPTCGGGGRADR